MYAIARELPRLMRRVASFLMPVSVLGCLLLTVPAEPVTAQQQIDEEYSARIREYTTEDYFLTPYVDYLPSSGTVPTPLDVLGHIAGAPEKLSYSHEVYAYMRALADASPRVSVSVIGTTEEGREMILVIISDEKNLRDIERYKEITARLADPRTISGPDAEGLMSEGLPMYWATGAMHSPETGSPEMLMELAYRLAVDEKPFIKEIRDNSIVLITPILEVDGRDKQVDLHMAPRKDAEATVAKRLVYWGKYVGHDNNRDGLTLSLKMSQNIAKTFSEYHPQVIHDLHESIAYLYTSTGTGPYNAWIDPILINEWNILAYQEVTEMTKMGVPGVWTHGFYDGWAPNYMFYAANGHNAIGRFYETQSARDGSTKRITSTPSRAWFRPNPPLESVMWSLRNNVNLQQSALLIAMHYVAVHRHTFLENFYMKSRRSVQKASAEGPAAYILPAGDHRKSLQARLVKLLMDQGVEVHRASKAFTADDRSFGKGSYIIRMDQPYSRMADMMLDRQYYNPEDPRPYDDVGWTLGALFDTETVRIDDTAVLSAPMERIGELEPEGGVAAGGTAAAAYLVNYDGSNALTTFRFKYNKMIIHAAEKAFSTGGRKFNAGSFIIKPSENRGNLEKQLDTAGKAYGFTAFRAASVPEVPLHPVSVPRIALVHTWTSTQVEGWVRIGFDEYGIPYDYISVHDVRDNPRLRDSYDVIVFGSTRDDVMRILKGLSGDTPVPWKKTDITPNIGREDSTDDMRGGLELRGVVNLNTFIEDGGLFITLGRSSALPVHFGLADGVSLKESGNLWAPGGVYTAVIEDSLSPVVYGYGGRLGVYFNSYPVFSGGRGASGTVETTDRPSGRGGVYDEDIFQGRPRTWGVLPDSLRKDRGLTEPPKMRLAPPPQPSRNEEDDEEKPDYKIIMRFTRNVDELLVSGGIRNGEELADAPALIRAPIGDGNVLMFSFNPLWRGETQGSYALVFNAMLHYDNLDSAGH